MNVDRFERLRKDRDELLAELAICDLGNVTKRLMVLRVAEICRELDNTTVDGLEGS